MNTIHKIIIATLALALSVPNLSIAGNKDRLGSAGAPQLLVNPWARGGGLANSNI